MNDVPFGFGPSGDQPDGPAESGGAGDDPAGFMAMFGDLQRMMSASMSSGPSAGPVNWGLAKQLAEQGLAGENPGVSPQESADVQSALSLADLWLDEVTDLPSGVRTAQAWTRSEWVDKTMPGWGQLCDPVAGRVSSAMAEVVPADQQAVFGPGNPLAAIMNQVGGMVFGAQVGQGISGLAREVVAASDVGIPLATSGEAALVPANVEAFGAGLGRPADEVRLYLALREAAHQRLFVHVPWLAQRLVSAVEGYARGFTIDLSTIESAMSDLNPSDPQAIQEALSGGMFEPQNTPEQDAALRRVETLLALVEGWVDSVVAAAAGNRMPGAAALREASRRRRASGGPAEQTFATLVGLELRPRRLREAAALWWAVTDKHGVAARDHIWDHPDLLPTAEDLDDPLGFADTIGADPLGELTAQDVIDGAAEELSPGDQPNGEPGEDPETPTSRAD